MTVNLDKIDFSTADPSGFFSKLADFPKHCQIAFEIGQSFAIPSYFIKYKKIVICGMGASGISASILADQLSGSSAQITVVSGYSLPGWVDKETLVIALSHSGDTEEVLTNFVSAYQRGCKLMAITTGGRLLNLCTKYRANFIQYNFSGPARAAFPYLFLLPLVVLSRLGFYELSVSELEKALIQVSAQLKKIEPNVHTAVNPAKDLATKFASSMPVVFSADNISGCGHWAAADFSENSKIVAFSTSFPALNHNLLAALNKTLPFGSSLKVLSLESKFSSPEIKKRINLTMKVLSTRNIPYERLDLSFASSPLSEIFLLISFIDYLTSYIAILNGVNPADNSAIDRFKSELAK